MNFDEMSNSIYADNNDSFSAQTKSAPSAERKTARSSINQSKTNGRKPFVSSSENSCLQRYFNEVGKEYTFNSNQEIRFAIKIRVFESFHKVIKSTIESHTNNKLNSSNQTRRIASLNVVSKTTGNIIHGYKSQFANSNLRLVISLAKNFSNRGLLYSDLIQEGNIGLLKAIDRFDPYKGDKFSTYASWWIQQSMNRTVLDQSRLIRLPVKIQEEFFKINKSRKSLSIENGTTPKP
ncbi:MAG: sigma-70 family RNA polymerase sigma factor [Candidatus Dadabacteria bacterium]|nr:sigma-70 family RNA polymerase sigma factor [Candidatus Dadabacteria bacterium]NIS08205.1 sigma-70 family RNA polymerase sigma factor [Candidatus Dadabacteria bacterium]NIV41451.1 sigma-70 family RNA polymerase sigma factor [Candidatus Dadabacteria bacterium]NIY21695.1 sigma-70 family RNA polymerase sigma factor [Candidatus Dadabacteria bacterium]